MFGAARVGYCVVAGVGRVETDTTAGAGWGAGGSWDEQDRTAQLCGMVFLTASKSTVRATDPRWHNEDVASSRSFGCLFSQSNS